MSNQVEKLTIVIPCLNEEYNLPNTIDDISAMIPETGMDVRVIMIDDGSRDGTPRVMEQSCARFPWCRMKVNGSNLGPGRCVTQLYDELDEDTWVSVLPGDNEIVASSLLNYTALRDRYDIILGFLQNAVIRTVTRRAASAAFTAVAHATYGFSYRYLNGPKLYRVRAFRGIDVRGRGHAFNAELLAKAILREPGLRIGEAPFYARGRQSGSSTAFTPRAIWKSMGDFYTGYRSVAEYRKRVISEEPSTRKKAR